MYACIFRESPEGLPSRLTGRFGGDIPGLPSAAQAAVMQRVAWETVVEFWDVTGVETTSGTTDNKVRKCGITIFPNPAKQHIEVLSEMPVLEIHVYNHLGQRLLSLTGKEINIEKLPEGIYLASIVTEQGRVVLPLIKK
jgi:hypothetical protein